MRSALFSALAAAAVLAAIVCGFTVTGSPETARLRALDARRVNDLHDISMNIDRKYSWQTIDAHSRGPLVDVELDNEQPRRDPQTRILYPYVPETGGRYRICATFSLADNATEPAWLNHHAGRQCFERDARTDSLN